MEFWGDSVSTICLVRWVLDKWTVRPKSQNMEVFITLIISVLENRLIEVDFTYLVADSSGPGGPPLPRWGLYPPVHSLAQSSKHPTRLFCPHFCSFSRGQGRGKSERVHWDQVRLGKNTFQEIRSRGKTKSLTNSTVIPAIPSYEAGGPENMLRFRLHSLQWYKWYLVWEAVLLLTYWVFFILKNCILPFSGAKYLGKAW